MASVEAVLIQRLAAAFTAVAGEEVDPAVRRSQRADFQADGALALARKLGRSPREIAGQAVERAMLDDVCSATEIAGPGFINLTVRNEVLSDLVTRTAADERLGVRQRRTRTPW
jgi:arginyl-tRNA synthetase